MILPLALRRLRTSLPPLVFIRARNPNFLVLFVLLGWNLTVLGADFFKTGEGTLTLGIPLFPIAYALGFCAFLQCFSLIGDVARIVLKRRAA